MAIPQTTRKLRSPPIEEAILDIQFAMNRDVESDRLQVVVDAFAEMLPHYRRRDRSSSVESFILDERLRLGPAPMSGSESYRADYPDIKDVTRSVSIRADGITVRHARPYKGWEDLYEYAEKAFHAFSVELNPVAVIRLAARYVNKIVLPNSYFDFDHFFRYGPQVPGNVSQQVFDFQTRIGVQGDPLDLRAWISQYLYHEEDQSLAVMLDIDVFRSDWHPAKWEMLENPLEEIHMMKNKLFFGSLTDSALRAYE